MVIKARKGLNVIKVMARDEMPQRILCLLFDMLVLSQVDYGFGILKLSKIDEVGCNSERRDESYARLHKGHDSGRNAICSWISSNAERTQTGT